MQTDTNEFFFDFLHICLFIEVDVDNAQEKSKKYKVY
jgi:hypothetical protein